MGTGEHFHDFVQDVEGTRHYVFLRLRVRHGVQTITVTKVGYLAMPIKDNREIGGTAYEQLSQLGLFGRPTGTRFRRR